MPASMPAPPRDIPPAGSHRELALDQRIDYFLKYHAPPEPYPDAVDQDEGLLAGPRRLTNRAFDALDEMGDWVLGRRY